MKGAFGDGRTTLFPTQLSRLASEYQEGGAVVLTQDGSTVTAFNGEKTVRLNAQGDVLNNPNQESLPLC